jgi:hypothetical protein
MMPTGRPTGRGSLDDPDIAQGRPRDIAQKSLEEFRKAQKDAPPPAARAAAGPVALQRKTIMNFARDAKSLLISGGLAGAEELAGTPALVDAAVGRGHVIMFAFNPMWRHETHGSFALVTNAMLNHKNLSPAPVPAAPPAPPAPKKQGPPSLLVQGRRGPC